MVKLNANILTACALVAVVFIMVACGNRTFTNRLHESSIEELWKRSLSQYGIIPTYPLRERVFVGDMRLTVTEAGQDIKKAELLGLDSKFIGHLPIEVPYTRLDGSLPEFPKTKCSHDESTTDNASAKNRGSVQKCNFNNISQEVSKKHILRTEDNSTAVYRLRLVEFPKLELDVSNDGRLLANFGSEVFARQ